MLSQALVGLVMVGVHGLVYRKAGRGEGKGLGSREVGFDAGNGRGSAGKCCSGVLMAARVTWESMRPPLGDIDGTVGDNGRRGRMLDGC